MYLCLQLLREEDDLRANHLGYLEYCSPAEDPIRPAVVFTCADVGPGGRGRTFLDRVNFQNSLAEMRNKLATLLAAGE